MFYIAAYLPARELIIATNHRQGAFAPKSVASESNVPGGTFSCSNRYQLISCQ